MKECTKCGIAQSEENFYWKKTNVKRSSVCKVCQRDMSKSHYNSNKDYYKKKSKVSRPQLRERGKAYVINYLLEHPCVDCGESDIEVLEFDHVEPLNNFKAPRVGALVERSIKKIQEEIDKCEVRCANCHTRRTRRLAGTLRMP